MARIQTRRGRSRRMKNEMNVVPYIDVMLVLLVIFMVTAPMITPGLINLPSVGQASAVPATPVEIEMSENGEMKVRQRTAGKNFQTIDKTNLVEEVKALVEPDSPVVIAADGKVPYEEVMKVMDTLRSSGLTRLGLLVNQKSADGKQ
ncbi:biopolymer transporter ExbD [Advenella kashmirensis W13003]|uniref:Biopolymer transporter ExbD n=1 Tax=Advenella kashmirensis W13003 TaxID=1424334 RepID=V8QUQ0_9BURK|nr:protein TolR [Advenella kashmirensis]ETF03666.1 biopolymer transporter ExbD [Advenella kashmirensis W13003]